MLAALALAACGGPRVVVPARTCGTVAVPLRLEQRLPLLRADVAGTPVDLMLDLGGFDTVSLDPVARVPVAFTGRERTFRDARGDLLTAREYRLPAVSLGAQPLRDVVGTENVHAPGWQPPAGQGYVGLGVLRHFHLDIDYGSGALRLLDRRCPAPARPGWTTVPLLSDADGVTVAARAGDRDVTLVLDTGATASTLRPGLPGPVTFGGVEIPVVPADFPVADGLVGADFFAAYEVAIDFEARTVAFRPHPAPW
jgi:hypothetical protein